MFNWITAGESHGAKLVTIISGMVSGLRLDEQQINSELSHRRLGYGRGARMGFEQDKLEIIAGIRHGVTLPGPIAVEIHNSEWDKWKQVMSPRPIEQEEYADQARAKKLSRPRPGHADLVGSIKYAETDVRNILERASARETAARVVAGSIAKQFLKQLCGVDIVSHVVSIGQSLKFKGDKPLPTDLQDIDNSPVRAFDKTVETSMVQEIDNAKKQGDTLGGEFEVIAYGVPLGLGDFSDPNLRLDSRLAAAIISIPAVKGIEFGSGFELGKTRGSAAQDEIYLKNQQLARNSNNAGGIEGGMSNGNPIVFRAVMKPISTVPKALDTIDLATGEKAKAINQRSDICAVPAAAVIAESMTALILTQVALDKFGGNSITETEANYRNFLQSYAKNYPNIWGKHD